MLRISKLTDYGVALMAHLAQSRRACIPRRSCRRR